MIRGMLLLFVFQFLGECFVKLFMLKIPGPIIGLLLLLIFLMIRKKSFDSLDTSVVWLLKYLPLFIIPAALGIITQIETISKELWPILISLVIGTIISLIFGIKLMDMLMRRKEQKDGF